MCGWIESHFHDWIDYNGVAFSIELLEWGRTFSDIWEYDRLHIYFSKHTRIFVLEMKRKVFFIESKKRVNS